MKKMYTLLFVSFFIISFSQVITAQLLTEDFDYPAGDSIKTHGWSAHSGVGNAPVEVSDGGLTFEGYAGSGIGNAALVYGTGEDVNKGFEIQDTDGGSVYLSALVNVSESSDDLGGGYFLHLGKRNDSTTFTSFCSRVFAKVTGGVVSFGLSNTSTANYASGSYNKNTTYLLIVKYTINKSGNDETKLWIRTADVPADEATAGVADVTVDTQTGTASDTLNAVGIRQASGIPDVILDGIRVSTAWDFSTGKTYPGVTIAEARKDDNSDLIADYSVSGDTLKISGVITSPNFQSTRTAYFVQDATAGVEIYFNGLGSTSFEVGDSVFAIGTVEQYHGLVEFTPLSLDETNFGIISYNAAVPEPVKISATEFAANSEAYEGILIRIDSLTKTSGTWPAASSGGSIYLTNASESDTVQMYINSSTEIGGTEEPVYPINLIGIGGQYSSGSTVDGGYEIFPRFTSDIISSSATPKVTIAEARKDDDSDLIADYSVSGDTLEITGVITSPNFQSTRTAYFVQDATAGIEIYFNGLGSTPLEMGDSVYVIGTVEQYHGLVEFVPVALDSTGIGVLKKGVALPSPVKLTLSEFAANPEAYEGILVKINGLTKTSGTWPAAASSASIYLTDASKADTVQMYINSSTDIGGTEEPAYPINLTGIGGQYSSGSTVNAGYEIFPRMASDITTAPATEEFTIAEARKDEDNDLIADYSVSGDTLMISGIVTSPNLQKTNTAYFIQDATAGIEIFYTGLPAVEFAIGDSVSVIGTVEQYHGLVEFAPLTKDSTSLIVLKHGLAVPAPKKITLSQFAASPESYEGTLIRIDALSKTSGTWPAAGSGASIYVTNKAESDTVQIYINSGTNIGGTEEPAYPVNLIGIGGQYSSGTTVDGGYEIFPRMAGDIYSTPEIPVATIAEAKKDDDSDLIPDHSVTGDTLMITGVITSPNLQASNTAFFIQDATGGIEVFKYNLSETEFTMGDSVFAIGTVLQYHGLTEFSPLTLDAENLGIIKSGATMPAPMNITVEEYAADPEYYEGMLVKVDSLYKADGSWPAESSSSSLYLSNSAQTDTVQIYMPSILNIGAKAEPDYPVSVTGIGAQYSSGTTVNNGYEIIPRDTADIQKIIIVGVDGTEGRAYTFQLYQNYPNPFNPATIIKFELPASQKVELTVFDILGRKVKTLYNSEAPAGITTINFNASNLASGMYIYTIRTKNAVLTKKLMLLK